MPAATLVRNLALFAALAASSITIAQQKAPAQDRDAVQTERRSAMQEARKATQAGPIDVPLLDQGKLTVPAGFGYVPIPQSSRLMKAMGNSVNKGFLGLVVGQDGANSAGFFSLTYDPSGYIKDDDARDMNADDMIKQLREGTDEQNKERRAQGIAGLVIDGWVEPPRYDVTTHQLVWSVGVHGEDSPNTSSGINYRTIVLGREGMIGMTMVTSSHALPAMRPFADQLLAGLIFKDGKRYADFNSSTDHIAEIGLAALITGVAVKKLGLFALAAAFLVKFGKIIIITIGALMWKLRKRLMFWKKQPELTASTEPVADIRQPAASVGTSETTATPAAAPAPGSGTSA